MCRLDHTVLYDLMWVLGIKFRLPGLVTCAFPSPTLAPSFPIFNAFVIFSSSTNMAKEHKRLLVIPRVAKQIIIGLK